MNNAQNNTDGQYIVIQNGQRVTAPTPSQQEAQQEADKRNKLLENEGAATKQKAEVKRNLFG